MKKLSMTNYQRVLVLTLFALLVVACGSGGNGGTPGAVATLDQIMKLTLTAAPSPTATVGLNPTVTPPLLITSTPRPATATPELETATPEPPIAPTETPQPTETPLPPNATAVPTRTATRAPTRSPFTSTPDNIARPNGAVLRAFRRSATIDGDLSEWGALPYAINSATYKPQNISGVTDSSATFALGWDATNLYVAVNVIDESFVQTQSGALMYKGDSVEILFDVDLRGDFAITTLNGDDVQLGLSPGDLRTGNPAPQAHIWYPSRLGGTPSGARVAGKLTSNGYTVEAAIPWSALTASGVAGSRYGFVISVSDNDTPNTADQQSMISSVPTRRLFDPTSWGTLVLDN